MNQEVVALLGILAALAVGVVSPGPSYVMVARTAVAVSRRSGLGAALGMGVGGVVFASAALWGLQAVFQAVPLVYLALKVLGGLYLCYLGYLIFRSAKQPPPASATGDSGTGATRGQCRPGRHGTASNWR